ncbi:Protein of unknown function [Pseudomonas sp. ok272]|uniref:alpha/beta hydrolase family protein n=1 Tax=unclassified Pseudomonas TaxID=196821 RepID=UPI0008B8BCC1|nr:MULTISPECIES: alpha/beta hydrolase family protein [unclassified Pseudomonas]SEM77462.1 Protein of unknown function [Pseudomonas sp. ok272]SFM70838.1 Protein of unknown function [Pseudomonas sp. ok602]
MPFVYRLALPALCLSLLLPCAFSAQAADPVATPAEKSVDEQPVQRQPLPERSQAEASALERSVPAQEQQSLQAGSDRFLALWKPANTSEPKGVVIIIPGAGETADWPQAIGPLRQKLPDADWGSLSLTLPDLQSNAPQPRIVEVPPVAVNTENANKDASTTAPIEQVAAGEADVVDRAVVQTNDEQLSADAERIYTRIEAAITFAEQQNARSIVLLGHGTGAYWAARYLSEKQPSQVQKFVMVGAMAPTTGKSALTELSTDLKLATLDLYYQDTTLAKRAALERLQASKRLKDSMFKQVSLKTIPGDSPAQQEQLFRRVRGWLSPLPVSN